MADNIQITEKGVFIPYNTYQGFGEIEVVLDKNYILIKPKNVTLQFSGFINPTINIKEIQEEYDLSLLGAED